MKTIKFKPWPFSGLVFLHYNKGGWMHLNRTDTMYTTAYCSIEGHSSVVNNRFRSIGMILGRFRVSFCWMRGNFAWVRREFFTLLCLLALIMDVQGNGLSWWRIVLFGILISCFVSLNPRSNRLK